MKKKYIIVLLVLMFTIGLSTISAHGVDVTNDKMVIADDANGQQVKDIADSNNINISVYKFTSEGEVEHQLEHMLNNSNKQIIVVAYQDTAKNFLKQHQEVKDRLIIMDTVDNNTLKDNMQKVMNSEGSANSSSSQNWLLYSFIILAIILVVGAILAVRNKK